MVIRVFNQLWLCCLLLVLTPLNGHRPQRYLLYTVNPGEGFNLRRDVHMRASTLVNTLRQTDNWVLVLPSWSHLYHWKSGFRQDGIKWERFFDVASLNEYVPSIEYEEYLQRAGNVIDKVYTLQHYSEGWGEKGFIEKYDHRPCIEEPSYRVRSDGSLSGYLGSKKLTVEMFGCVSVQGFTDTLVSLVNEGALHPARSVLLERLETVMHSNYGGLQYWAARYSMVYAGALREAGNEFMINRLDYDPGNGSGRQPPLNGGGHYLAIHLRRRDYIHARPDAVPSLKEAASQINALKTENNLSTVYLSSDAPLSEKKVLSGLVDGLVWYHPSEEQLNRFGDGGVAIIEQWIAAHAQYFVGSIESTFSFRIREDRQLMRFSTESTFNQICRGPDHHSCQKPSKWLIDQGVWDLFTKEGKHLQDEL